MIRKFFRFYIILRKHEPDVTNAIDVIAISPEVYMSRCSSIMQFLLRDILLSRRGPPFRIIFSLGQLHYNLQLDCSIRSYVQKRKLETLIFKSNN